MTKLIVFDFDGTLADTRALTVEIFQEISKKHDYPVLSHDEIEAMRKLPIRKRLKIVKVPLRKVPGLMKEGLEMMKERIQNSQLFDGIQELLEAFHGKIPMVILSSNQADNIHTFLAVNQITQLDDVIGSAKLFGKERPLKKLLKAYQIAPEEMLYVGDEIRDIVSCQNVGIPIAAVTWGFDSTKALKAHNPTYLCETPEALHTTIQTLIKKDA